MCTYLFYLFEHIRLLDKITSPVINEIINEYHKICLKRILSYFFNKIILDNNSIKKWLQFPENLKFFCNLVSKFWFVI